MLSAVSFWHLGRGDEADAASERGLALVRDAPPSPAKASVLIERSRLLMLRARFRDAIEVGREGLALAEDLRRIDLQISALVNVGSAMTGLGVGGVPELERAIELGKGGFAPLVRQRAYNNLADEMLARGRVREAVRLFDEARAGVEPLGIMLGIRWNLPQQAWAAYYLGDWVRVEELLRRYEDLIAGSQGHYLEGMVLLLHGSMARARGDGAAAVSYAERSVAHSRGVKDPQSLGPSLASLARAFVEEGRDAEAFPLVDEVLALTDENGVALYFGWLIDLGWLIHDLGRADMPPPSRAKLWAEAATAITEGDLVRAAEVLGETELMSEEAYARLRAAELLASQGRNAEAQFHLERALSFYRSVGATAYLRRAEAVMPASA
jgi:tetratricopeptide (TPR) repeat protein